jgi:type II secretory pathway component PulF
MAENRIKKWAMLQMWRLQQVAQPLTLAMLAITLSLHLWGFVKWRGDFMGSYGGVLVILLVLATIVWIVAFIWDVRLKMWREQISVLMLKNPFVKERMTSKEIAIYAMTWIPVLEHMGKDNPALRAQADRFRDWLKREVDENVLTKEELEDILEHIGSDRKDLFGLEGK